MQTPARRTRRDAGYSLVEVLVAVVLTGTIVMAIVGAMFAVVRVSGQNDDATKVQAVLGRAADELNGIDYLACPEASLPSAYDNVSDRAADSVGWGPSTVEITAFRYWNPDTEQWDTTNSIQGSECNPAVGYTSSKNLQKLTIEVTSPSGNVVRSIDIVKSNLLLEDGTNVSNP
jgi:type II secretory pathway pseudopilin PulG